MKNYLTFSFSSFLFLLAMLIPAGSSAQTGVVVGNLYVPTSPGGAVPSPPSGTAEAVVPGNTQIGTTGVTEFGATRVLTTGTVTLEAAGIAPSGAQNRGPVMNDTDAELIAAYGTSQVRPTSLSPSTGIRGIPESSGGPIAVRAGNVETIGPGTPTRGRP